MKRWFRHWPLGAKFGIPLNAFTLALNAGWDWLSIFASLFGLIGLVSGVTCIVIEKRNFEKSIPEVFR